MNGLRFYSARPRDYNAHLQSSICFKNAVRFL